MSMLSKIPAGNSICKVFLDFDGLVLSDLGSSFSNSVATDNVWIATHFSRGSVSYKEESFSGQPGTAFKQTFTIKLPSLDNDLALRTSIFHQVKNIKLEFTNGVELAIGRNDLLQNRPPRVETKSDQNFLIVEFYTETMIPIGIVRPELEYFGFPEIFPI